MPILPAHSMSAITAIPALPEAKIAFDAGRVYMSPPYCGFWKQPRVNVLRNAIFDTKDFRVAARRGCNCCHAASTAQAWQP